MRNITTNSKSLRGPVGKSDCVTVEVLWQVGKADSINSLVSVPFDFMDL